MNKELSTSGALAFESLAATAASVRSYPVRDMTNAMVYACNQLADGDTFAGISEAGLTAAMRGGWDRGLGMWPPIPPSELDRPVRSCAR